MFKCDNICKETCVKCIVNVFITPILQTQRVKSVICPQTLGVRMRFQLSGLLKQILTHSYHWTRLNCFKSMHLCVTGSWVGMKCFTLKPAVVYLPCASLSLSPGSSLSSLLESTLPVPLKAQGWKEASRKDQGEHRVDNTFVLKRVRLRETVFKGLIFKNYYYLVFWQNRHLNWVCIY